MAAFDYTALNTTGKQTKGVLEADSLRQVRQLLRDQGLSPLSVEPSAQKSAKGASGLSFGSGGPSIGVQDLSLLTRQMATLIQAGLPLEECLGAVSRQTEKPKVRSILMAVRSKVLEGYSLADSLGEYPKAFPKLYRSTVSAGEHSGHLDTVMNRLADYTETSHATQRQIKTALAYPGVLLFISIVIVGFLMSSVVPSIIQGFESNQQELPINTLILIAVSDFVVDYGLITLVCFILLGLSLREFLKRPHIKLIFHKRLLKTFFIGKLIRNINTARFASTLSILTSSGVSLVDAMKIAGEVLSNEWLKLRVGNAVKSVSEGSSLKNALEQAGYFPPMMLHMIASGEASGELDTMLDKVAKAQDMELETFIAVMLSLMPPLMIVLMAFMVFNIILAILLPIIQQSQLVGM